MNTLLNSVSTSAITGEVKEVVARTRIPRLKAVADRVTSTKRQARTEDLELSGFTGKCFVCVDYKLTRYIADLTNYRLGCLGTAYEPSFYEIKRSEKRNKIHFALSQDAKLKNEFISGIPDYNLFAMLAYDLDWQDGMVLNHKHGDQTRFDGVELVTQSENARHVHHMKYVIGKHPECTYETSYGKRVLCFELPAKSSAEKIKFLSSIPSLWDLKFPKTSKSSKKHITQLGAERLVDAYAEGYIEQVYGVTAAERALYYAE
jgi:hypothetical protein